MSEVESSDVARAVVAKLYNALTGGEGEGPLEDGVFSWNTPGMPMDPSDLEFLTKGLTGIITGDVNRDAGGKAADRPDLTPDSKKQSKLLSQAEDLARLVDFIPDVAAINNNQFSRIAKRDYSGCLSEVYRDTLNSSQVYQNELPADVTAKLKKFRGMVQETRKVSDLITGEERDVTVDGPMMKAYKEHMQAYLAVGQECNNRRIDALAAYDSRAVNDWALNGPLYRQKVEAAMNDWVISGYKNEVEQIAAFIDQATRNGAALLKRQYLDDLENAQLTSPLSGSHFFATSLIPATFATSSDWTRFVFNGGEYERYGSGALTSSSWPVKSSSAFLGLFGGGEVDAVNSRTEYDGTLDTSRISLSLEMVEVPISRVWFQPGFLTSRSWRFHPMVKNKVVSDGGSPPNGILPAYPTSALFIRDLSLSFGESPHVSEFVELQRQSHTRGNSLMSFGPFFLGGNAPSSSADGTTQRDWGYRYEHNTISVDGMQLIGFRCHLLPKSPNPDPGILTNEWT